MCCQGRLPAQAQHIGLPSQLTLGVFGPAPAQNSLNKPEDGVSGGLSELTNKGDPAHYTWKNALGQPVPLDPEPWASSLAFALLSEGPRSLPPICTTRGAA